MDYNPDNVVHIIPTNGPENWNPNSTPTSIWAPTEQEEEDYQNPAAAADADHPPNKKSPTSNSRSKSVGRIFFKTKLCCKFRQSACPYNTNCNFAHTVQELQRPGPPSNWHHFREEDNNNNNNNSNGLSELQRPGPPSNWHHFRDEDNNNNNNNNNSSNGLSELRQELQIPSFASSGFGVETRSSKGRHCKKFYTGEGCPYGDSCTFIHDESSRSRESVAISLGPGGYGGGGGGGGNASGPNSKPLNWKTRICNKWETTGYCPFGSKCHFAHGSEELYHHTGGPVEGEIRVTSAPFPESKQTGASSKPLADSLVTSVSAIPRSDVYHVGVPSQRTSLAILRPGQTAHQKWKGPDKISRIYGDWIDDVE